MVGRAGGLLARTGSLSGHLSKQQPRSTLLDLVAVILYKANALSGGVYLLSPEVRGGARTDGQGHFRSVLSPPKTTWQIGQRGLTSGKLEDLGRDMRSGKYRSEMPLAISAGFGGASYFGR
ncbi:hypothetical protein J6590_073377 [Homalodisca vitripennis]|nr:hypothetical protein J6590_073377 [Homalodisca vitripennis]